MFLYILGPFFSTEITLILSPAELLHGHLAIRTLLLKYSLCNSFVYIHSADLHIDDGI